MKFFSILCVVIVAVLLENAFADPEPEPKIGSKEFSNKGMAPEDAINMMLYYGARQNLTYPIRTFSRMLQNEQFNKARPTVVFFHCLDQTYLEQTVTRYVETFLRRGDYNVLVFDWSYYSGGSNNFENLPDMQVVANTAARYFMEVLKTGYSGRSFYFIGFSVGANMAGAVAREIYKGSDNSNRIGRVTALDPFMPSNYAFGSMQGVNEYDGTFVDIIHTDTGSSAYTGNVDFYPNGGRAQPGCKKSSSKSKSIYNNECGHNRAWEYYMESVNNPTSFLAIKCRTWSDYRNKNCDSTANGYMGFYALPRLTRDYYLKTNERSPYSRYTKLNKNSSKFNDNTSSSSSSSSSSEESNERVQNSRNGQRNNEVRQNMQRNTSGGRSNERLQNNQNQWSNSNQGGRLSDRFLNNQGQGSFERLDQNQRENLNNQGPKNQNYQRVSSMERNIRGIDLVKGNYQNQHTNSHDMGYSPDFSRDTDFAMKNEEFKSSSRD